MYIDRDYSVLLLGAEDWIKEDKQRNLVMLQNVFKLFGIILFIFVPTMATAQSPEEKSLKPFEKCETISDDIQRLACFDSALILAKKLALSERDGRRTRSKEDFGLSSLDIERRDTKATENNAEAVIARRQERAELKPDKIESRIVDFYVSSRSKKGLYVLENGQIWQETSPSSFSRSPRPNATASISRSGFGGFRMRIGERKKQLPVKRVR